MHSFQVESPCSIMEVFTALKEMNWRKESCAIKAGGTDLLVWIKKRAAAPEWIIDLSRIPELGCVVFSREKGLFIGAMATANEVAIHPDVVSIYPGIAEACLSHSDQLIRNKATVVGNVCSAVPSGDLLPILGAYEAEICLLSENEERFVKIENFITGPRRTVLEKNEIVSGVVVPVPSGISTSTYLKLGRRSALDLAQVGVACLALDRNGGRCYKIVCGAVAPTPIRAREAEKVLENMEHPNETALGMAAKKAVAAVKPINDVRASKAYRCAQVGELVKRSVVVCAGRL